LTLIGFAPAAAALASIASGSDTVKKPAVPSMRFCTSREEQGRKKNRFPLHLETLYGAARLCHWQSWIIFQYQRLGGRLSLWRAV
jgi:hypothetical protein